MLLLVEARFKDNYVVLSFSTDFPLRNVPVDSFAQSVGSWVAKMPLGPFDEVTITAIVDGNIDRCEAGNHRLERLHYTDESAETETLGFRHSVRDGDVTYSTEIVYHASGAQCWVGIRNDRISDTAQLHLKESKKPQIIKALLKNIGGGKDGQLLVRDTPHILKEGDQATAITLINGEAGNSLPIVYVSRDRRGNHLIDALGLARMAGGLAHVVLEPSRSFSRSIQDPTFGGNAYGGAIGIYTPSGEMFLLSPEGDSEHQLRVEIVDRVRKVLLHRLPKVECTWRNLEVLASRRNIEKLREAGSTDLEAFVREFDVENRSLSQQLEASTAELNELKARLSAERRAERGSQSPSSLLKSQDYFPSEGAEFIRDALNAQLGNLVEGSRRQMKVQEAITQLGTTTESSDRRERLKNSLNKADSIDDISNVLEELGLTIKSDKNHYKLLYADDERFSFTAAKTASDHRAFKNLAGEIAKKIF